MAAGSRGKPREVRRERFLKTLWYTVIVAALTLIGLRGGATLEWGAGLIVAGGAAELLMAALGPRPRYRPSSAYVAAALGTYALLSAGFLRYLSVAATDDVLLLFFVVFCFDSFSQVVGQMLGRTRLAPRTSPNKTVEGFLGGLAAAVAAGWVASHWSHLSWWLVRAVAIALSSLAGDLAASHFKRQHGIKDFSDWIPHQGGFLDRFDSLIAAGAACSAASLFLPEGVSSSHAP
jgi:phosphatidate cytidylyltransferase